MIKLKHIIQQQSTQIPTIDISIRHRSDIDVICKCTGFTYDELANRSRKLDVVTARYVLFAYFRKRGYSFWDIADLFKITHATVVAGINRMNKLIDSNDKIMIDAINKFKFNMLGLIQTTFEIFMANDFNLESYGE